MKKEKLIYLVRHGETEFNRLGIVQGSGVDTSLNEVGRAQAKAFYEKYKNENFEVLITSKLKRTHETMHHFIQDGIIWEQTADINEMCWGVHEGRGGTPEHIAKYQRMVEAWAVGDYDARLEAGESAWELYTRINRFIEHLKMRPEQKILVCSHGRAIRCFMTLFKGFSLGEMENIQHANTALYKIQYIDNQFFIISENDVTHLEI